MHILDNLLSVIQMKEEKDRHLIYYSIRVQPIYGLWNNQVTLISNLLNDGNNAFDAKQFSFKLGRHADGAESELTIGGTNPARFSGALTWSGLSDNNGGSWIIPVDDIIVNGQPLNFVG